MASGLLSQDHAEAVEKFLQSGIMNVIWEFADHYGKDFLPYLVMREFVHKGEPQFALRAAKLVWDESVLARYPHVAASAVVVAGSRHEGMRHVSPSNYPSANFLSRPS
jgi:hypothetical protein